MFVTVIGYGTIGRMHARILRSLGAKLAIVDPRPADHPAGVEVWGAVDEIPKRIRDAVDVWLISTPTAHHLSTLRNVLAWQPAARVLMEKPACASDEVDDLLALLAAHPPARFVVNQQYRHSQLVSVARARTAALGGDRLPITSRSPLPRTAGSTWQQDASSTPTTRSWATNGPT